MNAVSNTYNNVYNYYMSNQMQRQTNKFDAHKKSELRSVYNSIVKISKDSPVYIFDHSAETFKFAINVKEDARALKNTLSALDTAEDSGSLIGQKIAVSSNPELVSVEYLDRPTADADEELELNINQLAAPQVNTGYFLNPHRLKLMPNNYTFDIQTSGLSYGFQFQVSHQDTNRSIQDRIANLINKSNIGILAEVVEDNNGYRALRLTSNATGDEDHRLLFQVSEDANSLESGAVAYLGLDHVSDFPKNAEFTLNGEAHSALSNTFTINQNFELSLHGTTEEDESVIIGFKPDIDTVNDNIKEMTKKYNSLIRLSGSHANHTIRNNVLGQSVSSVARKFRNSLESIGLSLADDGTLDVDDQLLNQSLNEDINDTVDSIMQFKSALADKTDEVMLNPMDYVDKKIVSYPNPGKTFANPYLTSIYSGMLFNSYC